MKSLYESLGQDPDTKEVVSEPWPENMSGREFARRVLDSVEFREYIVNGILARDIPPAIMCRVMDHGWGQPVKRVEVSSQEHDLSSVTEDQLYARAAQLFAIAAELRSKVKEQTDEKQETTTLIH